MNHANPKNQKWNLFFGVLLFIYTVYGFWCMPSFGSPTDEFTQRAIGTENARFIAGHSSVEKLSEHQFFGPIVETPLYLLEQLIYTKDISTKIYLRHSVLFALFISALVVFFKLLKGLTKNDGASFFITLVFACNPRLFAHAHYNSKDTAFLCLLLFGLYCFVQFIQHKNFTSLLLAAVWLGAATSIRLAGAFILMACISTLAFSLKSYGKPILYFCVLSLLAFIASFPYLWVHPLEGIGQLITYTTQNPYPWEVLFAGKTHLAGAGLWYYVPLSLALSSAIVVLALFLIFFIRALRSIARKNFSIEQLLILQLFALPLLYFMITQPVFYNMGRHTQFMLIPIYLGAGMVLSAVWSNKIAKNTVLGIIALTCLALPVHKGNEMVYFNGIKSLWKPYSFELDYWTLSAKRAMQDLLKEENTVSLYCFDNAVENSLDMLPPAERERIKMNTKDSANFELVFFRETPLQANEKTIFAYGSKNEPYLLVNRLR